MKTFDVVIKDMKGKVVSVIGKSLSESKADRRLETGLMRINRDTHFVDIVPVRSNEKGGEK